MAGRSFQLSMPAQLDKIDKLRELGVAEYIALPQLVVVGDQSSGKSSVLEAISELPFPRDSGLCTRFPTNITFRRSNRVNISISVIPASTDDPAKIERYRAFKKDELPSLTGPEFLEILKEAAHLMGISGPDESTTGEKTTFSNEVFKVELSGPTHDNLSINDIPGIFRTPTPGVTTKADMNMVKEMVHNYIRDERTIILAVIAANVDIATQEILTMAEEVDSHGNRTLGVLTKPDLVDEGGEANVMDLILGKRKPLKLGYCIVRNRGQKELSSDHIERSRKEKEFFQQAPWSALGKDRVGATSLKSRLQQLLADITKRELPKVKAQTEKRLLESKRKLGALGAERADPDQQRSYLQSMAVDFQKVVNEALDAQYARNTIFANNPVMRLATISVDLDETFSKLIEEWGHTVDFSTPDSEMGVEKPEPMDGLQQGLLEGPFPPADMSTHEHRDTDIETLFTSKNLNAQNFDRESYPELSEILPMDATPRVQETGTCLEWIEKKYREFRAQGLLTISPAVLPSLWKEQTQNWDGFTMAYMKYAVLVVHDFIKKLLEHICTDEYVCRNILMLLEDKLVEKYEKAFEHAKFILAIERDGTLLTTNHYFNSNIQEYRSDRLNKRLEKHAFNVSSGRSVIAISQVRDVVSMENVEYATQEIHDILKAYYTVAQKRMVDSICMQASAHYLFSGDESPLRVFSTQLISELSVEQLEMIAGEEAFSKRQRKELKAEIQKLEEGRKVLRF